MSVSKEHQNIRSVVEEILFMNKECRSNDDRLYFKVVDKLSYDRGINIDFCSVSAFFNTRKSNGYPSYATVVRERRKIQRDNPTLCADPDVEAMRELREEEYREWAVKN